MQHKQNLSFFTKSYFFNITKIQKKSIFQKLFYYITKNTTKKIYLCYNPPHKD